MHLYFDECASFLPGPSQGRQDPSVPPLTDLQDLWEMPETALRMAAPRVESDY